jgi:hypothetical protein
MNESPIKIRLMKDEDFDAVVGIDRKVLKASRPDYDEMKFEKLFRSKDYLPVSLVAEEGDGANVGISFRLSQRVRTSGTPSLTYQRLCPRVSQ